MSGEQGKKRLDQGFDMVSILTDTDAIIAEFTKHVTAVRESK
jgi:4-hydroxy-2-oxoheptanedioate aldolase